MVKKNYITKQFKQKRVMNEFKTYKMNILEQKS